MAVLVMDEKQLRGVARRAAGTYEYNGKGFVLINFGNHKQNHVRLDLAKWESGRYQKLNLANAYEYQVSSFHVKRETWYSEKDREQDFNYLYFSYVGAGVWQPVWGYGKTEKFGSTAGRRWEGGEQSWSNGMEIARYFLEDVSKETGVEQGLAMGPVQGAAANLSGHL